MVQSMLGKTALPKDQNPSALGGQFAAEFLKYRGHPYFLSGYFHHRKGWDCSSAINWVLSRFGITLPGGVKGYDGTSHGPVSGMYMFWKGARTIPHHEVEAGDLIIYGTEHIAMAISHTHEISAADPADGTKVVPLGAGPGPFVARRITAVAHNQPTNLTSITGNIFGALNPVPYIENALGVSSFTDLLERGALMLFGAVLIIVGIFVFIDTGGSKSKDTSNSDSGNSGGGGGIAKPAKKAESKEPKTVQGAEPKGLKMGGKTAGAEAGAGAGAGSAATADLAEVAEVAAV